VWRVDRSARHIPRSSPIDPRLQWPDLIPAGYGGRVQRGVVVTTYPLNSLGTEVIDGKLPDGPHRTVASVVGLGSMISSALGSRLADATLRPALQGSNLGGKNFAGNEQSSLWD